MTRTRSFCTKAAIAAATCVVTLIGAASAQAEFGFTSTGASLTGSDGQFSRQAGAHPDFRIKLWLNRELGSDGIEIPDGGLRDTRVVLPSGMLGNSAAFPTCTFAELMSQEFAVPQCPIGAQVGNGTATSSPNYGPGDPGDIPIQVYNMKAPSNLPALFAFQYAGAVVEIVPRVRAGDYAIVVESPVLVQSLPPFGVDLKFWGVPADPSHDGERLDPTAEAFGVASPSEPAAFFSNPTFCPEAVSPITVSADSWEQPGAFVTSVLNADFDGTPFMFDGCQRVPFAPAVATESSPRAAAPTGLNVDLEVPQSNNPDGFASAHVRKTVVTLPEGFTISPSAAAGQGACTEAQIGIGSNAAPTCPPSSKLGTVKIKTPLLDDELEGDVILAKQTENPFGSLLAMYLAVKGPGFYIKLPGKVEADPNTGQLTTSFDNQPQLPYERVSLKLRGGPGAPLVAPSVCGTYPIQVQMTSWASPVPVELRSPLKIDEGCANGGFKPGLRAGTANPLGGKSSAFTFAVTREDGEQNISRIDTTLPEGVLAKLAGVPLCGDAQAATGACPAASQVGTATVGAGAGSTPIYVPEAGKAPTAIYLAGPYKGAPYSLVVKVPAQAGPFDLGTVTVRNGIYVDPVTTRASVKSDPLPQILQGIPIAYRDIRVEVNRPDFILNPTSCDPMKVDSTIVSAQGASASPSARFQVGGCGDLGFKPKLALKLSGPTHRSAHPKLRAVLTARRGDANIARAQVTLPRTEFLENAHIQTICTRVQFAADNCPAKSIYGQAKAWSPLLDKPLEGPVYLRSSSHELPDLVASLDGQIHVDLQGRIDSVKARIRNTFDFVPDAPVSKFVLTMQGGKKGLLVNNTELCKATPRADIAFDGQNGKVADSSPLVKTDCGKGRKGKKK